VSDSTPTPLPIGFEQFHPRRFINYQLNRAHALGHTDTDELRRAAASIDNVARCVPVFEALAGDTADAGRLRHASSYLRIAEFFTPCRDPQKVVRYRRYRELFDRAFADSGAVRHDVAYAGSALPAYRLAPPRERVAASCCCTAASTRSSRSSSRSGNASPAPAST
jgi:hypothetical protein